MPARMNLATMLSGQGRAREAEELLRESISIQPTWGRFTIRLAFCWQRIVTVYQKPFVLSSGQLDIGRRTLG